MKTNYQLETEKIINREQAAGRKPSLLLHACCAPCSSYVLEYLTGYFDITVFFYNPNIAPRDEFDYRINELKRFVAETEADVKIIEGKYDSERFYALAKGFENDAEGGERCFRCYRLRLEEAAKLAKEKDFDYFTTTLSISPYKNAEKLNEIGGELSAVYGVGYLYSDFKKKNGYKRSVELSAQYGLYRQDYCGCVFSKAYSEKMRKEKSDASENG